MLTLKNQPTLKDFQEYVEELEKEREFTKDNVLQKCLMLGEEIGELFKSVRKSELMKIDNSSNFGQIDEELADIIIFLCSIANRYSIDLEKAFRAKEEKNKQRIWK